MRSHAPPPRFAKHERRVDHQREGRHRKGRSVLRQECAQLQSGEQEVLRIALEANRSHPLPKPEAQPDQQEAERVVARLDRLLDDCWEERVSEERVRFKSEDDARKARQQAADLTSAYLKTLPQVPQ